jgi:endonuclease/exonuclease/phosphatase family metal-dependent hydrolase
VARHPGIVIKALTWNLFHGRAHPPAGLDRPLFDEFAALLERAEWDIALLQEAPPRWFQQLGERLAAHGAIALTSRNFGAALRGRIADRKPDLIKSNEGGSNQLFVRPPWRIAETRRLTLARFPERRRALWVRLGRDDGGLGLTLVNLHASANRPRAAARELLHAAAWADETPLIFGGDLNLRPAEDPATYGELEQRFALGPPTGPTAIDHLLARGLELVEAPRRLTAEQRMVDLADGRRISLSDHAPVAARFAMR